MKKIAIIGALGYVGKGMVNFFKDHYEVISYDISLGDKCYSKEIVNECDLAVICVPTETAQTGECDT